MGLDPLRIRRRQYLSGIDWFVRALDSRTRAATGTGNYSQVVLVLNGTLASPALRRKLDALIQANPILAGRCRRGFNLAPYWSIPRRAKTGDLFMRVRRLGRDLSMEGVLHSLGDVVNYPLEGKLRTMFTLVPHGDQTYVAMQFDHQLFDASGAERLLQHISEAQPEAMKLSLDERPSHLDHWRDKFASGRVVNREFIAIRGEAPPAAIPLPPDRKGTARHTRFLFRSYSAAETEQIRRRAEEQVGYLLLMPYLLGASVYALQTLSRRRGLSANDYVVPVSLDARPSGTGISALFFNQLSFNLYRFQAAAAADPKTAWQEAVRQMYTQVQRGVAHHMANAGMLMRILPAPWLARLMEIPLRGGLGSMAFALLGRKGFTADAFMGYPVERIFHMPRVPTPPGLGVFFAPNGDRLTLTFSYLNGMLDRDAAEQFVAELDATIMGKG